MYHAFKQGIMQPTTNLRSMKLIQKQYSQSGRKHKTHLDKLKFVIIFKHGLMDGTAFPKTTGTWNWYSNSATGTHAHRHMGHK